jgi:peptidylprolyl isomerase
VGTEKRERQKTARLDKIIAEQAAAKKARTRRTALRGAIAVVVVLAAALAFNVIWGNDDDSTEAADDTATSTTLPEFEEPDCSNPTVAAAVGREAPDTDPPPEDTAPDALEVTTLVEGTGDGAADGDTLVVHYLGKIADGTIFDCSWNVEGDGQPFPVTISSDPAMAQVIQGWNEGLIGAKAGERRHLVIGSDKAYGSQGGGSAIPPDAPLSFDVDILEVQKAGTTTTVADPTATTTPTSAP